MPLRPVATACALAGLTLLLYGARLSTAPLATPETAVTGQAQTVPSSHPLFFHVDADRWLMPAPVYATALVQALPAVDAPSRAAAVIVAALDVVLIFACARQIFASDVGAIVSALLLMVTPAHVAYGRSGSGDIFAVPFVLLGLLGFSRYLKDDRSRDIALSGVAFGAGVYTQPAAPLTMGFLLVLAMVTLLAYHRRRPAVLILAGSFAVLLIPAAIWFVLHQDTYPDTFGRWVVFLAHVRNPLDGVRAFLNWNTLGNRASLYWGFLDPAWLFFGGPLLLSMLPLALCGLAKWRRVLPTAAMLMLAGGALVAPLAGSSFGQPHYLADALVFLPFAVLLVVAGVMWMWTHERSRWRWLLAGLAVTAGIESFLVVAQAYGFRT